MAFSAAPFADLPVSTEEGWDPEGGGMPALQNDILGDAENPDWERYKKAHLIWDPDNAATKAGYKVPIARMVDGRLTVISRQLGNAAGALNGSRAPLANVTTEVKRRAFSTLLRYYAKAEVPADRRPEFRGTRLSRPVSLQESEVGAETPKWVHVATEGEYLGYDPPFTMTREHFDQMVANIHAHPSFRGGPNGVGTADVIPWDFNHATERDTPDGAAAQGWTRDLAVRTGPDGKAQLWALTLFLEPVRTAIREGRFKWASIGAWFDAVDPVSGENVGAIVTSICVTNTPFIEGMNQLAAERQGGERRVQASHYYGRADSPSEAMEYLRDLFGLSETQGFQEVMVEIAKLRGWLANGGAPLGVDVNDLVGAIRQILNMGPLDGIAEVIAELDKLGIRLVEEQALSGGDAGAVAPLPPTDADIAGMTASTKGEDMSLLKKLSAALNARETDDAVIEAVEDAVALRAKVRDLLASDRDKTDVLLEDLGRLVGAKAQLDALIKALDADDPEVALERVVELSTAKSDLAKIQPEIEAMRAEQEEREKVAAEADVDAVIAASKLPANVREALLLMRKSDPDRFAKTYPVPRTDEVHLGRRVVGDGHEPPAGGGGDGAKVVNLAQFPGRNKTERAMRYLRATVEGADKWSHDECWEKAIELMRRKDVVDQAS